MKCERGRGREGEIAQAWHTKQEELFIPKDKHNKNLSIENPLKPKPFPDDLNFYFCLRTEKA